MIIIIIIRINKNKLNPSWTILFLKFSLPFFSITFFGQTFLLFISIFDCINGNTYENEGIKCPTGLWFSLLGSISIIALILLIIIAIITNLLYFKPVFMSKKF